MADTPKRGGRVAGTPNKVTATVKDNILAVFNRLGGTAQMAEWAQENQTEFYRIYAKLLPADIKLSGDPEAPIAIQEVRRIVVGG
jgi:uncharacterized MAPEG superfamily protein